MTYAILECLVCAVAVFAVATLMFVISLIVIVPIRRLYAFFEPKHNSQLAAVRQLKPL
jgi:hypothetical protein